MRAGQDRMSGCDTCGTVESRRMLSVTLAGDRSGDYVIVDEREDGSLVLAPDTSMAATGVATVSCRQRSPSSRPNTAWCSLPTTKG
jgi:hypothetical protein